MWTKKAKILAFGAVTAYVIALANDSWVLYAVSGALIGLLGVCFLLARRSLRGIDARRIPLTHRLVEATGLPVQVEVANAGRGTRWRILVEDRVANLTTGRGDPVRYTFVAPHIDAREAVSGRGEYPCPVRGRHRLGPLVLHGSDPLGLFLVRREIGDEAHAIVYPRPFRFPRWLVRGGAFLQLQDLRRSAARGQGLEFYGVREYVPGDDLRHVHWKVTAHVGRLSLREFEAGAPAALRLFLDLHEDVHRGIEPNTTLHSAVRVAASAARECVLQGGFVQVAASARRPPRMPSERGDAHLHRILEFLADARADGRVPFAQFVRAEVGTVATGSDVILITPSADPALAQVAGALLERGTNVVVVLLDAESFRPDEQAEAKPHRWAPLSGVLRRMRRSREPLADEPAGEQDAPSPACERLARELAAAGARVAVVRSGESLEQALAHSLRPSRPAESRGPVRGQGPPVERREPLPGVDSSAPAM